MIRFNDINNILKFNGKTAIVLGSGLDLSSIELDRRRSLKYNNIKSMPVSSVSGHKSEFISGFYNQKQILISRGRFHFYEGLEIEQITLPIKLFFNLGVKNLIITNSAGSINKNNKPGSLMVINGHFDCTFKNGYSIPQLINGGKYYSKKLINLALDESDKSNILLKKGKYCWTLGPNYETPAEINFFRSFGGDSIGMSTVPEVEFASKLDMNILVISALTNFAAGISDKLLTHEEVLFNANKIQNNFTKLLLGIINNIN